MSLPSHITYITSNQGKLQEFKTLLHPINITHKSIEIDEIQGDIMKIAKRKVESASLLINGPVFVEDSCLCFDAFGELPGPYIKDFLEKLGPDGLPKLLMGFENKKAKAVCTIGFSKGNGEPVVLFQGVTHGMIVESKGQGGFGWDVIFQPDGHSDTYGSMSIETKNSISHRGLAAASFKEYLEKQGY